MVTENKIAGEGKDKENLVFGDRATRFTLGAAKRPEEEVERAQNYLFMVTSEPKFMPVSQDALEKAHEKLMSKMEQKWGGQSGLGATMWFPESDPDLMRPRIRIANIAELRVHIVSLFASAVIATVLMMMGILSTFASTLPNPVFWVGMGFPACGVAVANLIILLSGGRDGETK